MSDEMIPVVGPDMVLMGIAERKWVEEHGLCRLTTLMIPFRADGTIGVQTRPEGKSYAGYRDFFGGGVCMEPAAWGWLLGRKLTVGDLIDAAAMREANEELRLLDERGIPEVLTAANARSYLFRFGEWGAFPWKNEQLSTLYLFRLPRGMTLIPMDDVKGRFVAVETEFLPLKVLLRHYSCKTWQFADGAERVLQRLEQETALLGSFTRRIAELSDSGGGETHE